MKQQDNQPCAVTRLITSSAPINESEVLILDICIKWRSQELFAKFKLFSWRVISILENSYLFTLSCVDNFWDKVLNLKGISGYKSDNSNKYVSF